MPRVTNGEGVTKATEVTVLAADGKKNVPSYEVPWGFYLLARDDNVPPIISTSSINSCFAYISRWNDGEMLFFAHVSTDGETLHIIRSLIEATASDKQKLSCIAVVGKTPQPATTYNRIQNIITTSKVPHMVFRAPTGCVTYEPHSGNVQCVQSTSSTVINKPDNSEVKGALFKDPNKPLLKMPDSEELELGTLGLRRLEKLVKNPKKWSQDM